MPATSRRAYQTSIVRIRAKHVMRQAACIAKHIALDGGPLAALDGVVVNEFTDERIQVCREPLGRASSPGDIYEERREQRMQCLQGCGTLNGVRKLAGIYGSCGCDASCEIVRRPPIQNWICVWIQDSVWGDVV